MFVFPVYTLMKTCVHMCAFHDGPEPLRGPCETLVLEFSQDLTWSAQREPTADGAQAPWLVFTEDWTVCGENLTVTAREPGGGRWDTRRAVTASRPFFPRGLHSTGLSGGRRGGEREGGYERVVWSLSPA